MVTRCLALALFAALAACAATPAPAGLPGPAPEPLEWRETCPLRYQMHIRPGYQGLETAARPFLDEDHGDGLIDVKCDFVRMDSDAAAALLGWRSGDRRAWIVDDAAARVLLERGLAGGKVERIAAPRLTLHERQRGSINVTSQTAYVAGYVVSIESATAIADPQVEVVSAGAVLDLVGETIEGSEAVRLDLELRFAELQRPIAITEASFPGGHSPVAIQRPLVTLHRLEADPELAPDECLILAVLCDEAPFETVFAFVSGRSMEGGRPLELERR